MLFFGQIFFILLISLVNSQYVPQTPCPGTFDYIENGDQTYGKLTFHLKEPSTTVNTIVNFTIAEALPTRRDSSLELLRSELDNQERTVSYKVHFPKTSPLPYLTELTVNGDIICHGPEDKPGPGKYYLNSIVLQNTLTLKDDLILPISKYFSNPRPSNITVSPQPVTSAPGDLPSISITKRPPRSPIIESRSHMEECGVVHEDNDKVPLILNGKSYKRGNWPWLTAIYKMEDGGLKFVCSGTLVSHRHVISAAHCIQQGVNQLKTTRDIIIKLGAHDLDDWIDEIAISRTIQTASVQDAYDPKYFLYDIMVFTLKKRVQFNNYIRPACLWSGNPDVSKIVGATGVVAGWKSGNSEPLMTRLQIVSTEACHPSLQNFTSDSANTFCTVDLSETAPCVSDFGGGFYIMQEGRWRVRGVLTISLQKDGDSYCHVNTLFADTAKFMSWIINILMMNSTESIPL